MNKSTGASGGMHGGLVRLIRERDLRLDVYRFAHRLGLPWQEVVRIERGLRPATPEEQRRITAAINVPVEVLFAEPKTPSQWRRWTLRLCEHSPAWRDAWRRRLGLPPPRPKGPGPAWWGPHGRGYRIVAGQRRHQRVKRWAFDLVRLAYGPSERRWANARPRQPNLVKIAREGRGYTVREAAAILEVSPARVSRIEKDFAQPRTAEVNGLSYVLEEPLTVLFPSLRGLSQALDTLWRRLAPHERSRVAKLVKVLRGEIARAASATAGVDQTAQPGSGGEHV